MEKTQEQHKQIKILSIIAILIVLFYLLSTVNTPLYSNDYVWLEAAEKTVQTPRLLITYNIIAEQWRPLTLATYTLIYMIGGYKQVYYRLASISLFFTSAILVFMLGKRINKTTGFLSAALFLSFAPNIYTTFRVDSIGNNLALTFYLLSFMLITRKKPKPLLAGASGIFSILAKEEGLTLAFVIMLRDLLKRISIKKGRVLLKRGIILQKIKTNNKKIIINSALLASMIIFIAFFLTYITKPYLTKPLQVLLNPTPEENPIFYKAASINLDIKTILSRSVFYLDIIMRNTSLLLLPILIFLLGKYKKEKERTIQLVKSVAIALAIIIPILLLKAYFLLIIPLAIILIKLKKKKYGFYAMWALPLTLIPVIIISFETGARYLLVGSAALSILMASVVNKSLRRITSKNGKTLIYILILISISMNIIEGIQQTEYPRIISELTKRTGKMIESLPTDSIIFVPLKMEISSAKTYNENNNIHPAIHKDALLADLLVKNKTGEVIEEKNFMISTIHESLSEEVLNRIPRGNKTYLLVFRNMSEILHNYNLVNKTSYRRFTAYIYNSEISKENIESGFSKYENKPLFNGSKLVVWFFGVPNCYECDRQKLVLKGVMNNFAKVELREYSTYDTVPAEDLAVLYKHASSNDSVPILIIGDVYSRKGASKSSTAEEEFELLTKIICGLNLECGVKKGLS